MARSKSKGPGTASKPGEYPRRRTGVLQTSIRYELDEDERGLLARVGTNVKSSRGAPYGRYLQEGTKRMLARPWLTLAIAHYGFMLRRIIETGKVEPSWKAS